jgi:hypothetical protein
MSLRCAERCFNRRAGNFKRSWAIMLRFKPSRPETEAVAVQMLGTAHLTLSYSTMAWLRKVFQVTSASTRWS